MSGLYNPTDGYMNSTALVRSESLDLSASVLEFNQHDAPLQFTCSPAILDISASFDTTAKPPKIVNSYHSRDTIAGISSASSARAFCPPPSPSLGPPSRKTSHVSGVSPNMPWNPVTAFEQSSIGTQQQPQQQARRHPPRHTKPLTDSGYDSSKSVTQFEPHMHMANTSNSSYHMSEESRETRMLNDLPDQQTNFSIKAPSVFSTGPSEFEVPQDSVDQEQLRCDVCEPLESFNTKSEYSKHIARHKREHRCNHEACNRKDGFATKNDLDRHLKSVHHQVDVDDKVWRCFYPGCKSANKTWPRQDNFKAHIERMHKDADVDDLIAKSDTWLDNEEKPRRRREQAQQDSMAGTGTGTSCRPGSQFLRVPSTRSVRTSDTVNNKSFTSRRGSFKHAPSTADDLATDLDASEILDYHPGVYDPTHLMSVFPDHHFEPGSCYPNGPLESSSLAMTPARSQHFVSSHPFTPHDNDNDLPNMNDSNFPHASRAWETATAPELTSHDHRLDSYQAFGLQGQSMFDQPNLDPASGNMLAFMGPESALSIPPFNVDEALRDVGNPTSQSQVAPGITITESPGDRIGSLTQELVSVVQKAFGPDSTFTRRLIPDLQRTVREHANSSSMTPEDSTSPEEDNSGQSEGIYECTFKGCGKRYTHKNTWTKHKKRHLRRWFCVFDKCYKDFGIKQDMQRHEHSCHTQAQCWRCWDDLSLSNGRESCTFLTQDSAKFQEHRKTHHFPDLLIEKYQIEKDFAGRFWCGFCNKVVENPVEARTNGTARVNWRLTHIDEHIKDGKSVYDWYELDGGGKTKGELRDSSGQTTGHDTISTKLTRPRSRTSPGSNVNPSQHSFSSSNFANPSSKRHRHSQLGTIDLSIDGQESKPKRMHYTHSAIDPSSSAMMWPRRVNGRLAVNSEASTIGYVSCCCCGVTGPVQNGMTCSECGHPMCSNCHSHGNKMRIVPGLRERSGGGGGGGGSRC